MSEFKNKAVDELNEQPDFGEDADDVAGFGLNGYTVLTVYAALAVLAVVFYVILNVTKNL